MCRTHPRVVLRPACRPCRKPLLPTRLRRPYRSRAFHLLCTVSSAIGHPDGTGPDSVPPAQHQPSNYWERARSPEAGSMMGVIATPVRHSSPVLSSTSSSCSPLSTIPPLVLPSTSSSCSPAPPVSPKRSIGYPDGTDRSAAGSMTDAIDALTQPRPLAPPSCSTPCSVTNATAEMWRHVPGLYSRCWASPSSSPAAPPPSPSPYALGQPLTYTGPSVTYPNGDVAGHGRRCYVKTAYVLRRDGGDGLRVLFPKNKKTTLLRLSEVKMW